MDEITSVRQAAAAGGPGCPRSPAVAAASHPEMLSAPQLTALIDAMPDALLLVDPQGRISRVNRQAERLFGYAADELVGREIEVLVPPDLRQQHAEHRRHFDQAPRLRMMGERTMLAAQHKSGRTIPVEISLAPIADPGGTFTLAAIRDVSWRAQIEEQAQRSLRVQHILCAVLSLALEPISVDSQLERILDLVLSNRWLGVEDPGAILGYDAASHSLRLQAWRGYPADWPVDTGPIPADACVGPAGHVSQSLRLVEPLPDSPYPWQRLRHYCVPIASSDTLRGVFVVAVPANQARREETEEALTAVAHSIAGLLRHRAAQEALRKSEERFDLAVRGTDAGIWDWDLRDNRVYFSPRWKSILGYRDDELSDNFNEWATRLHPDDRQLAFQAIEDYLRGRSAEYELVHRLRHKDGEYRWIVARGAAERDAGGAPYRMVGSHIDITERKRADEAHRDAQVQLLAAQKIQQHLLPQAPPCAAGLEVAGLSCPAVYAGGDYFDYLPMADGGLGLVVADVAGHGFASSLLMASMHAFLRALAQTGATLAEIVAEANTFMTRATEEDRFVTLLLARVEPVSRRLSYINAGHPTGYVLAADGQVRCELASLGQPLGVGSGDFPPAEMAEPLAAGETILLMTDGLLEAESPDGQRFGTARAIDLVRTYRHEPAHSIVERLQNEVLAFAAASHPADDLTAVVVRVLDRPSGAC